MPNLTANLLRQHPKSCGYDLRAISDALGRPDSCKSAAQVGNRLSKVARKARESWIELAKELDQPLLRVIRNLVATAAPQDVEAFALCLAECTGAPEFGRSGDALLSLSKAVTEQAPWSTQLQQSLRRSPHKKAVSLETRSALWGLWAVARIPSITVSEALHEGRFDTPDLLEAIPKLSEPELVAVFTAYLEEPGIYKTLARRFASRPIPSAFRLARQRVHDTKLRVGINLLFTPARRLPTYVAGANGAELIAVCSFVGQNRLAALLKINYPKSHDQILRQLRAVARNDASLAMHLLKKVVTKKTAEVDALFFAIADVDELLKSLAGARAFKSIAHHPEFCATFLRSSDQAKADLLADHLVNRAWRNSTALTTFLEADAVSAKKTLHTLWSRFSSEADLSFRRTLLSRVASCDAELARSLAAPIALDDFKTILKALPDAVSDGVVDQLLRALAPGVFEAYLDSHVRRPRPLPTAVVRAACRLGGVPLLEAIRSLPRQFVGPALDAQPMRLLLPLAFKSVPVALEVTRHVSREQLMAEIPWVRATFATHPRVAAAYELALAASLVDARYLTWLSHKSHPPKQGAPRGHTFNDHYYAYTLPKDAGGVRTITAPNARLKRLQRRLLASLFNAVPLHPAATGFRTGQSIVTNAVPHVGKRLVVNVDITSFFDSTSYTRILSACRQAAGGQLSARAYFLLADLCSYHGHLPTGAPTSPTLANIILSPVDRALTTVAAKHDIAYTRYADDLTFSGGDNVPRLLPFAQRLLGELGYQLDPNKTNLFRRGRRQIVTGLVVNDKPNLPRRLRRRLRAAVHWRTHGKTPHWHGRDMSDVALTGRLAMLNTVQPEEFRAHRAELQRAVASPAAGSRRKKKP